MTDAAPTAADTATYAFQPAPDATAWIRPGFAAVVVCVVAVLVLGVLISSILMIHPVLVPGVGGAPGTSAPDPDAGTIAALAGAAFSSLAALSAAYFGIKVASEQATQVAAHAGATTSQALAVLGNSTNRTDSQPLETTRSKGNTR